MHGCTGENQSPVAFEPFVGRRKFRKERTYTDKHNKLWQMTLTTTEWKKNGDAHHMRVVVVEIEFSFCTSKLKLTLAVDFDALVIYFIEGMMSMEAATTLRRHLASSPS